MLKKWVRFENEVIARLITHGERFEIIVDSEKTQEFKSGKEEVDILDVLSTDTIFSDAKKGRKAEDEKIQEIFGTMDPLAIAKIILEKGEIQVTVEQRRELIENKKKQLITYISKNCINPKTGLPHPPERIRRAMDEINVSIDLKQPIEEQAKDIVRKMSEIIPIRMEQIVIAARIPPEFTGKAYGLVSGFGHIQKDEWQPDGSWIVIVEVPSGLKENFLEKLNALTKGKVQTKIL